MALLGIRIKKNEFTQDIMAKDCHFMMQTSELFGPGTRVCGILYKLDASKSPIPVEELRVFVPVHNIIQLFYSE